MNLQTIRTYLPFSAVLHSILILFIISVIPGVFASNEAHALSPNLIVIRNEVVEKYLQGSESINGVLVDLLDNIDIKIFDQRIPLQFGVELGIKVLGKNDPLVPRTIGVGKDDEQRYFFVEQEIAIIGELVAGFRNVDVWLEKLAKGLSNGLTRFINGGRSNGTKYIVRLVRRIDSADAIFSSVPKNPLDMVMALTRKIPVVGLVLPFIQGQVPSLVPGESIRIEKRMTVETYGQIPFVSIPGLPFSVQGKMAKIRIDAPFRTGIFQIDDKKQVVTLESYTQEKEKKEGTVVAKVPIPIIDIIYTIGAKRVEKILEERVFIAYLVENGLSEELTRDVLRGEFGAFKNKAGVKPLLELGLNEELVDNIDNVLGIYHGKNRGDYSEREVRVEQGEDDLQLKEKSIGKRNRRVFLFGQEHDCILGERTVENSPSEQDDPFLTKLLEGYAESDDPIFLHCSLQINRTVDPKFLHNVTRIISSYSRSIDQKLQPLSDLLDEKMNSKIYRNITGRFDLKSKLHFQILVTATSLTDMLNRLASHRSEKLSGIWDRSFFKKYSDELSAFFSEIEKLVERGQRLRLDQVAILFKRCKIQFNLLFLLAMGMNSFDDENMRYDLDLSVRMDGLDYRLDEHLGQFGRFSRPMEDNLSILTMTVLDAVAQPGSHH